MSRQWMTLMAILLVYIPVAIDATVLHVAAPLSVALGSSGNELLWIIDIYSLVMAGMVLPMGALGDKIGFKRLLLLGSAIFGIASLCALSPTYDADCLTRFAGGGGGDDRPGDAGRDPQHLLPRPVSAIWRWGCGQRSAPAARPSARWWAVSCWSISTGGRCS